MTGRWFRFCFLAVALATAAAGCKSGYVWRPSVPTDMRTVSVPTFRNESSLTELGSTMATQMLREFQREGTFRVRAVGDAALEVQGVVKSVGGALTVRSRRDALRQASYEVDATVEISVIDKRAHKVLMDNRRYVAHATYTASDDHATAERDAAGRLSDDLAQQVVDDILNMKW